MSFFFSKQEGDDNLQYDDTAFMHFGISTSLISIVIILCFIYRDFVASKIYNLKTLQKLSVFDQKLKNSLKKKKNYFTTFDFLYKFAIVIVLAVFGLYCYANIGENSKMIGFDPHEILQVSLDADVNTIKKSYRKLALLYHPDRNVGNPVAAAKFIQISKAYECLTDEQAKQKCQKYGNPDGATSFKVGIGLPRFMVDVGNQYFILIPIFIVLLIIVPRAFIKWSNRIKPMDNAGNLLVNYNALHALFGPYINPITFSVMFGMMKQLDAAFPQKKQLPAEADVGFKALLENARAMPKQLMDKTPAHIIYRIYIVYIYMANQQQRSQAVAQMVPELCHKITMFSLYYAQRMNDQKLLFNNPNWPINFIGVYALNLSIFFSKQMYNPSLRLGNVASIEFLDLTEQQKLMVQNIPIGNLHKNLLWDDQKINTLVQNFQQNRQKYIREQIQNLPALRVQTRVLLGDQQTTQMTIDDFAVFQIKISRKKQTPGYVITKDFLYLARQQFFLTICYNENMLFFSPVQFKKGQNQITLLYQHRQSVVRQMNFSVTLMSANYPNMDIQSQIYLNVINRIQNRKIEINFEDQNIQKAPKSFFQSLASMDAYQEQDRELSDGQDDQDQKKIKQYMAKKQCCDEDHQHEHEHQHEQDTHHRPAFRQEKECCDHQH